MKLRIQVGGLLLALLAACPLTFSQQKTTPTKPTTSPAKSTSAPAKTAPAKPKTAEEQNIQAYIDLIRSNVRQEKAQILGAVMQLNASDAAKFWDIYNDYDGELNKLNQMRSDNIIEYAKNYDTMTDTKADELIQNAIKFQKQRNELLYSCYEKVKGALGGTQAARFVQVEGQLLQIIDLQISSNLPLVGGGE